LEGIEEAGEGPEIQNERAREECLKNSVGVLIRRRGKIAGVRGGFV